MNDAVKAKALRQAVFHNGTSMVVAVPGKTVDVPIDRVQGFIDNGTISAPKGWDAGEIELSDPIADAKKDADVAEPLTGKNKPQLLAIAAAEGVTVAEGATNPEIVKAIEAARAKAAEGGEGQAPA